MKLETVVKNINSILNKFNTNTSISLKNVDYISNNCFIISIADTYLNIDCVNKIVKVCELYKEFKTHEHVTDDGKFNFIFDESIERLKKFDTFVKENYYFPQHSEVKTQKLIFDINKYEVDESVKISIYSDSKRAGQIGKITVPFKISGEKEVCVIFDDGKKEYFKTTEINRI